MTPERWNKIDLIFHDALQHQSSERAAFVSESCGGDEQLRQEVESLLASHYQAASFIEVPAGDAAAGFLAADGARLITGTVLNRYMILNLLGKGGMGEVYLAQDTKLKRKIALKLLPTQFTINSERVRRFEHEARAISALNHPNIVTIHEIESLNGTNFIVTEFVEGQTLRQLMSKGLIHLSQVLDIGIQIADALDAAHTAGIVHRDIKPENIMVRRDGYVKVLDFGLAKLAGRDTAINSTETATSIKGLANTNPGFIMGTVTYMSPEQATGGEVDTRTDIWSLGVVLYEMLTERAPFEGETCNDVIASVLKDESPGLTRSAEQVPRELERIVSKALRKNQDQRYKTVKDMALELKALKQELDLEARLERTLPASSTGSSVQSGANTTFGVRYATASPYAVRRTSSVEHLITEIKHHKLSILLAAAALFIAVMTVGYFYFMRSSSFVARGETIDSVAVLPFINVNNDPNTDYLSEGLSDGIIESLAQLPNLKKVISLSSVLHYKGKQTDPQAVGRELNVRAVLIGRVTQRGDHLSISAELVDVKDNKRLWHGQYDRKSIDALKLQGDIAQEISEGLRLKLTAPQRQLLAKRYTNNTEAYQLYLLGRFYRHKRSVEGYRKAVDYLEQAIQKDPNYASAYAELFVAYNRAGTDMPEKQLMKKKEWAVQKALEIDDKLAEAHSDLGIIKAGVWDWLGAVREFELAIELDPNSADVHHLYALMLCTLGRLDEALLHQKRAQELDPLSPTIYVNLGKVFYLKHQDDQAIEQFKRALELSPDSAAAHHQLSLVYLAKGNYEEAIAESEKARTSENSSMRISQLGYAYALAGKRSEAEKVLHELKEQPNQRDVSPNHLALIYMGLGDRDQAIAALQKEYDNGRDLAFITYRTWDSLRSDPRFTELLRRMKLAP